MGSLGCLLEPFLSLRGAFAAQLGASWAPLGLCCCVLPAVVCCLLLLTAVAAAHIANTAAAVFSFVLPEGLPDAPILHLYHPKGCQLQLYCVGNETSRRRMATYATLVLYIIYIIEIFYIIYIIYTI